MSKPVLRCDLLAHAMNRGKERAVRDLLLAWRDCAVLVGREQWRLFFEAGRFDKNHRHASEADLAAVAGAANRLQMIRYQTVGILASFLSNRQNEFSRLVESSTLPAETKHQLHFVNRWAAWFSREPLTMKDGAEIAPEVRKLARVMMRRVLFRHRKPDLSRSNMVVDQRAATVRVAESSSTFPLWLRLSTMERGQKIEIPLLSHDYFERRAGTRKKTVQINERDGRLFVGIVTDIAPACKAQKEAYTPRVEEIALDYGLRTLFATDQGDLLGRGFIDHLRRLDAKTTRLAAYRQKHGLKTRCARYDGYVTTLRGYLRTEIGRVLNRLVEVQRPGRIIVEKLCFRSPHLSKRLNRLVSNCGRRIISEKLDDLNERFGIEIVAVNAAYSSQTCSLCEYVDRKSRSGEKFCCRWCGHVVHADVNAPRNLRARRSRTEVGSVKQTKAAVLRALVRDFPRRCAERSQGRRGTSRDPRWENPYFPDWTAEVISSEAEQRFAVQPCASAP